VLYQPPTDPEDAEAEDEVDDAPADEAPTTQPAAEEIDDATEPAVSSEEVGEKLMEEAEGAPVLAPVREYYEDREQPASEAPMEQEPIAHPGHGHMVVNRLVTVLSIGEGNWLEVAFTADNTGREPPLRLLPCAMLPPPSLSENADVMVKPAKRYHVSGEITDYRGRKYLLLRKIMPWRNMGEF